MSFVLPFPCSCTRGREISRGGGPAPALDPRMSQQGDKRENRSRKKRQGVNVGEEGNPGADLRVWLLILDRSLAAPQLCGLGQILNL